MVADGGQGEVGGVRGDGGTQGGGGRRVAQAVEDEGLAGDPPGVLEDQAGEGIPSAADQVEAESLEVLAAGGQAASGCDGADRVSVPGFRPGQLPGQQGGGGGLA